MNSLAIRHRFKVQTRLLLGIFLSASLFVPMGSLAKAEAPIAEVSPFSAQSQSQPQPQMQSQPQPQQRPSVKVTVLKELDRSPLAGASGSLLNPATGHAFRTVDAKEGGKLVFLNILPGEYTLQITYVGYETYQQTKIVVEDKDMNLGEVLMKEAAALIDEIVVEGNAPSMQLAIDRKIFNVAESVISTGGTAADLLANIPSLQVDVDGNVSLRGSTSVKVLIDGKESSLGGSDIASLLQSMPAGSIDRVEVVTNPSARYDAEGQSGMINIVLKKNIRRGLNGSVNGSAGSYDNYGAGINLNYRDSKFNYHGSYNFNRRARVGSGNSITELLNSNSLTANNNESSGFGMNHSVKAGVDHYIGEKTTISLATDISFRQNKRNEFLNYTYTGHPTLVGTSERESRQDEDDLDFDINLDLRQFFSRKGEELSANLSFGRKGEDGYNRYNQLFSSATTPEEERYNETGEKGYNFNFQVDYIRPLSEKSKFEAGYRSHIRTSDDRQFSRFALAGAPLLPDYDASNEFEMNNQVHALYLNYQQQLTESLGFQVGVRGEQAILETAYIDLDPSTAPADVRTEGRLDYFRLYPSVFLTKELPGENQLQASYTRRVNRPRGWQVNPFVDLSDALNMRQGNPNLLPEDVHAFEFSYAKNWSKATLTSSAYYRLMDDVVQPIITVVDGTSGATLSQWQNISRSETTGFEFIGKYTLSNAVDLTGNFNAFHTRFHGNEEYGIEASEGFSWNANLTTNVKLLRSLSGQVKVEYQAPRIWAQGKGLESYVVDGGLRWDVLSRRASINFNVRDLLNQRRWGGYTLSQNVRREFESRWSKRMFTLSFNYRFGDQDMQRQDRRNRKDHFDTGGAAGGGGEVF